MHHAPDSPLISVVIPNYNGARYLEKCLKSLLAQTYPHFEIVIVDNASHDDSIRIIESTAPESVLIRQKRNTGFAGGVNAGIRASRGTWIAVLNNDTEAAPGWLAECVSAIRRRPDAAFLACRILEFSGDARLFSAGDCFLRGGIGYRRGQEQTDREDFHREGEIFSASGCAALYRRDILERMGGFDERFFAYLEDVELGLRIQAACHKGFYIPGAEVFHHGGATSGGEFSPFSVRMRTRNSLLLLIKSMPVSIVVRCLPMITLMQLSWFLRAAAHARLVSYFRGLAGALLLAPTMIRERNFDRRASGDLWRKILASERLAGKDFEDNKGKPSSVFLTLYFRLFANRKSTQLP